MIDRRTIEVYDRLGHQWIEDSHPQDPEHVAWVNAERSDGPVVDIGCGPGWSLEGIDRPALALDASRTMLAAARSAAPDVPAVLASAAGLPFRSGSLGGAVANRVLLHLERAAVPLALADLHRALGPEGPAFIRVMGDGQGTDFRSRRKFAGRLFSGWSDDGWRDVVHGAGFALDLLESDRTDDGPGGLAVCVRRAFTLADTVGPDMRLLICGLNPSPFSARAGVGFGRPGNRFWPAALAAGLVTLDRDPVHALTAHGVGMTDLVKRTTRRADELDVGEYRDGLARVERLVTWLQPGAVCFVGLAGWRAAVDRKAVAGLQPGTIGGRPAYLMPSTSGLNAHSRLDDLTQHLRRAAEVADAA